MTRETKDAILLALLLVFGFSAPAKNTSATEITRCFRVLDSTSGDLVEGALVYCVVIHVGVGAITHSCYTGENGECCVELEREDPFSVLVMKKGYMLTVEKLELNLEMASQETLLTPVAFLRIRLNNVPPHEQGDIITISYPGVRCNEVTSFMGPQVDTVAVFQMDPAVKEIEWYSEHIGERSYGSEVGISISPRDTLELKIEY